MEAIDGNLDKLLSFEYGEDGGLIGQKALNEMISFLSEILPGAGNGVRVKEAFDEIFARQWIVNAGSYRGTFPRRLSAYVRKNFYISLKREHLSAIGNIAKNGIVPEGKIFFDLTRLFKWTRGEFSDNNSCFWTERSFAKDRIIPHLGGFAIRSFQQEAKIGWSKHYGTYTGLGRAWVLPLPDGREGFLVFNGYGESTRMFANYLAKYLCFSNIESVSAKGSTDTLWFNNEEGFVVSQSTIEYDEVFYEYFFEDDPDHEYNNVDDWDDE